MNGETRAACGAPGAARAAPATRAPALQPEEVTGWEAARQEAEPKTRKTTFGRSIAPRPPSKARKPLTGPQQGGQPFVSCQLEVFFNVFDDLVFFRRCVTRSRYSVPARAARVRITRRFLCELRFYIFQIRSTTKINRSSCATTSPHLFPLLSARCVARAPLWRPFFASARSRRPPSPLRSHHAGQPERDGVPGPAVPGRADRSGAVQQPALSRPSVLQTSRPAPRASPSAPAWP